MPRLALRASAVFAKASYRKIKRVRVDRVVQSYWVRVNGVNELPDDAPVGAAVRFREASGRECDLLKVAEVPEWLQRLRRCPYRSVWYEIDSYHDDLQKHAVLRDPRAILRTTLEDLDPHVTVLQENDQARAVRFFRTTASLGDLIGPSKRVRFVKVVVFFATDAREYSFVKSLHLKRAIMSDRRILWP
ncbi:hypothetical protein [Truepera radiovictrix]|uniref:Uncharacterized protein n=1 Tax=Truepera radiovictrix (strain DSM 17093 / CIP 108686 / LMG 22925 / RQ-24) TaxID=649638 RepID=D7CSJ3_TRURR|nr:hypothetical protein [Truepera radiovictrix]ADI15413.1 hypothetical protein Trad_2303 [Truepera radiovictrix DSM 17093]WMT56036.1 hypothetical protein RCV51_08420 [Truepera radiovictrix]